MLSKYFSFLQGWIVYHTSTGSYVGVATLFEPGVKLDEKSIENGLKGQKFLVVSLFWGGSHHPYDALYFNKIWAVHLSSMLSV